MRWLLGFFVQIGTRSECCFPLGSFHSQERSISSECTYELIETKANLFW